MPSHQDAPQSSAPASPAEPVDPRELGWKTFQEELPQLVREHAGEWVAYQGGRRLGFARTRTELYQECLRRGLKREEFLVCCVEPAVDEFYFGPTAVD
jgi:hypothetical protein